MTQSSDHLDRIAALLATVAESQAHIQIIVEQNAAGLRETRAIADSNARAIEAWSSRMAEAITDTVSMIANLGRQHQETDQRFEVCLAEAWADRSEMRVLNRGRSQDLKINQCRPQRSRRLIY